MARNAESVVDSVVSRFLGPENEPDNESASAPEDTGADEGTAGEEQDQGVGEAGLDNTQDTGRASDRQGNKGDGTRQQPKGQKPAQARPGPQDIVDPQTGRVLATAGAQRRIWESAQTYVRNQYNGVLGRVDAQVREMQGKIAAYENMGRVANELQVTPAEQETGIKLVAAFKKNPVDTLKYLIEQAKAKGHNVDLGEGTVSGIDAGAMARMMEDKLRPILTEHANRERTQGAYREAEQELGQFYQRYPQARVHESEVNRLLQQFPDLTLETAYLRLQNWMLSNGLDPNQPIRPQVEQQQQRQQQSQNPTRPLPGGRGPAVGGQAMNGAAPRVAHEDTSYRDIVREAMREAGLQVN